MSNPTILWAQDREKIYLTLEIPKVKIADLKFETQKISIVGSESVNDSETNFELDINLYSNINPETVTHRTKENSVFLTLDKTTRQFWNRLTPTKQNNVKIDWQRWVDEEEENDTEEEDLLQNFNDFKKTLPSELLETDFTELLPTPDEDLEISDTEENSDDVECGENEAEVYADAEEAEKIKEDTVDENKVEETGDRSVESIDDGFLANGEESYTDASMDKVENEMDIQEAGDLVVDELDVERLDADLESNL